MKYRIDYEQRCPECNQGLQFVRNCFDKVGQYTHSVFFCKPCKTYFPILAGMAIAEKLTDETVILPDEIVE